MGDIAEILASEARAEPARILALRLQSLHEDDRAWILSQIEPGARTILTGLLEELRQLGFSALPALRESAATLSARRPADVPNAESDAIAIVDGASADVVWQYLRSEPDAIRRCLFAAHPWRWLATLHQEQAIILSQKGSSRTEPTQAQVTPRVRRALIVALARQVSARNEAAGERRATTATRSNAAKPKLRERITTHMKASFPWLR